MEISNLEIPYHILGVICLSGSRLSSKLNIILTNFLLHYGNRVVEFWEENFWNWRSFSAEWTLSRSFYLHYIKKSCWKSIFFLISGIHSHLSTKIKLDNSGKTTRIHLRQRSPTSKSCPHFWHTLKLDFTFSSFQTYSGLPNFRCKFLSTDRLCFGTAKRNPSPIKLFISYFSILRLFFIESFLKSNSVSSATMYEMIV